MRVRRWAALLVLDRHTGRFTAVGLPDQVQSRTSFFSHGDGLSLSWHEVIITYALSFHLPEAKYLKRVGLAKKKSFNG